MSTNTPLGSHFADGVRVGPIYNTQQSTTVADTNGVLVANDYTLYGPGVLLSPQNTYNIFPSPPGTGGGNTIFNNLVATTATGAVPGPAYLTLRGDNASTYYTTGPNGLPLIQFDWPRVVTVTIAGADATTGTHVTILGYDFYNFPMQQTYVVETQTTYPTVTFPGVGSDGSISLSAKAFYKVTAVHVSAALPGNCVISLGAADIFGLPYRVNSFGVVTSIQWGTQTGGGSPNANIIVPVTEMSTTFGTTGLLIPKGVFVPADHTNPATSLTGDVRGLYAPSTAAAAQTINGVQVDWKNLVFTSYLVGADTRINQIAAQQQQYEEQTNNPSQGVPISPLTSNTLYGVPQFYTGSPS